MAAYARRCQRILNSFLKSPIYSCSPTLQLKGNDALLRDFDSLFHSCAVRETQVLSGGANNPSAFYARRAYHSPARNMMLLHGSPPEVKAPVESVSSSQTKGIDNQAPLHSKNRRTYSAAAATTTYNNQQYASPQRSNVRAEADVKITRTSVCNVKPALQVEEHWFPLSNMDKLMPSVYEQSYFVYESTKGRAFGDIVSSLKTTLSEVLVPYYPLAGRMKNPVQGIYKVHCNGEGAEFAEAYADCDLDELDYHQPGPALGRQLAPTKMIRSEDGSLPPVCVQVTRFKCGGVIVGCSFHHQLVDVYSGNMFLKAWSQNMRSQPISRLPYHWRSLLSARSPPHSIVDHSTEYRVKSQDERRAPRAQTGALGQQPIVTRTFHFDNLALHNLKRETGPYTSTECTTTYLWRLIMKANGYADDDNAKMILSVDGRKRLVNPCVPEDYFGNMIAIASSESRVGELVNQPLANAAAFVSKNIARVGTNEYFRSLIDYIELNKGSTVMPNVNVAKDKLMIASSCIHLGMYEIDFGWGRPQFAGYAAVPEGVSNFLILLPSPLGHGNLNASVHMRADHMEKLEKDPEFEAIVAANELGDGSHHQHHHTEAAV